MRVRKDLTIYWNGDSPEALRWSLEYDGWHFDGTKEEFLDEITGMVEQMEISAREEKRKRGISS